MRYIIITIGNGALLADLYYGVDMKMRSLAIVSLIGLVVWTIVIGSIIYLSDSDPSTSGRHRADTSVSQQVRVNPAGEAGCVLLRTC